jgi:hypothetical protein
LLNEEDKMKIFKVAAASLVLLTSSFSYAGIIDLSSWTPTPGGNWIVQGGGSSVLQTTNGQPTYFLSDDNYINTQFDGSFGVETTGDDDFIGFVFGYNNSNDFLLFDWKQGDQSGAFSGFTLSKISGSSVDYWYHTGTDITVLASDYAGNNGWADNTVYNFSLDFTTTGIKIDIDGTNIFDVSGIFSSGKFGFYNYSQSSVRYTGFTEEVSQSLPEPSTLAIFALGVMGLASRRFKKNT